MPLTLEEHLDAHLPDRERVIDRMLVDLPDVRNTINTGRAGNGGWGFSMPAVYTRSYRRLEWMLDQLCRHGPELVIASDVHAQTTRKAYTDLIEFYVRAPRVVKEKRIAPGRGKTVLVDGQPQAGVPQYEIVVLFRPERCSLLHVRRAIAWLAEEWSLEWSEQPEYLTGKMWDELLNPTRERVAA